MPPNPVALYLSLGDGELSDEKHEIEELSRWLSTVDGCSVLPVQQDASMPGAKGDLALWSQIALAIINAGVLTGLVQCLNAYIKERKKSIRLSLKNPNGKELTLTSDNLKDERITDVIREIKNIL